jgi:thiol-disulfide isomerase/thioredoxin
MIMNPTQRVRAALHEPIGSMGTLAEDGSVVLPMLPETDGVVPLVTLAAVQPPLGGGLAFLGRATGWLNSPPLTAAELRGKVVLVQFWTYTCINWLRTLQYVRAWADAYRQHGLVVIGVHTPEFDFEHDLDNVRRAATALRVDYPIAVDHDYAIWSAFNNHYWPALYLVDRHENIRHHRFGEDDYEQSERILQQLLTEAGSDGGIGHNLVSVEPGGVEAAADWDNLRSPENYLGYQRTDNFASPDGAVLHAPHGYAVPARLRLNHWALAGDWTVRPQASVLHQANGRIAYRFHARDLHLVMAPTTPGGPIRFRVRLDGQPPAAAHGTDVDDHGNGTLADPRLYQLIRQPGPVTEHTFEITFLDPGVAAYAFTFG